MPRYPRAFLAGQPHHIVQRGHDRQPVFAHEADYRTYLDNLREQFEQLNIKLFSYCLMTNHIHLLVQPERDGSDVSRLMRIVAARQTRYINRLEGRSGTLWEGRFKCSIVDSDTYLLACCRYIELNPLRAGMVRRPEDYAWSSYRQRIAPAPLGMPLASPACYRALGVDEDERRLHYRAYVTAGDAPDELESIRVAVNRNQLTGNDRFKAEIERKLGRRISDRGPGRPSKRAATSGSFK